MIPPPPRSTLFPYTTLFRSLTRLKEQGILTARELEELKEAPLGVKEAPERMTRGGYFADYLQEVLAGEYGWSARSEEHTSELQSRPHLVCRLLLEKKNNSKK